MVFFKKFSYLILAWLFSLLFLLLFFEISLSFFSNEWDEAYRINIIKNRSIDYKINNLYNSKKLIAKYERNNFGLRDNCVSPSGVKILTIGGSTTDQRYVDFEDTFQSVFQNIITKKYSLDLCVSNAGIDGHSTHGHLLSFDKWFPLITGLNPKIIMFFIGINDADFIKPEVNNFDQIAKSGFIGLISNLKITQALIRIKNIFKGLRNSEAYAGHKKIIYKKSDYSINKLNSKTKEFALDNTKKFRKRMQKLISKAKNYGSRVICVTQPHDYVRDYGGINYGIPEVFGKNFSGLDYDYSIRKINQVMIQECGHENIIDLYNENFYAGDFYDGVHTTDRGSKRIGKKIAQEFINKKLINDIN